MLKKLYWWFAAKTWNYSVWDENASHGRHFHAWNMKHAIVKGEKLAYAKGWRDHFVMKGDSPWPEDF